MLVRLGQGEAGSSSRRQSDRRGFHLVPLVALVCVRVEEDLRQSEGQFVESCIPVVPPVLVNRLDSKFPKEQQAGERIGRLRPALSAVLHEVGEGVCAKARQ